MPQPLLLKKLRDDRTWDDALDDGGVTSQLGFRVIHDGRLHVVDALSGKKYVRPDDAEREIALLERSKAQADAEIAALKEELAVLRRSKNGGS